MTTNTTNSQAASIDTPEFRELAYAFKISGLGFDFTETIRKLIAHIDAKLAQVEREAYSKGADDVQAHAEGIINRTVERAEKAESRLAEIQRGVEGLTRWLSTFDGLCQAERIDPPSDDIFVRMTSVLALLQPQGQADTSGLPG